MDIKKHSPKTHSTRSAQGDAKIESVQAQQISTPEPLKKGGDDFVAKGSGVVLPNGEKPPVGAQSVLALRLNDGKKTKESLESVADWLNLTKWELKQTPVHIETAMDSLLDAAREFSQIEAPLGENKARYQEVAAELSATAQAVGEEVPRFMVEVYRSDNHPRWSQERRDAIQELTAYLSNQSLKEGIESYDLRMPDVYKYKELAPPTVFESVVDGAVDVVTYPLKLLALGIILNNMGK